MKKRKLFKASIGGPRYGKSQALRRVAKALADKGEKVLVWTKEGCFPVPKGCPLDELP